MTGVRASTPADERSLASTRLLVDLVNNTLDPGYAAAARRRGPDARRRAWERPAVALGCLLIGFLLVVSYVHTHRGAPEAQKVHDRLVDRVRAARRDADAQATQADRLGRRLAGARSAALPGASAQQLALAQLAAGEVAVHGPGFVVTLRQPAAPKPSATAGRAGTIPIDQANILTDRDVRSVVNELWHDGAEAIAVNGIRLTPTSAIRFAGEAVLVDFQPITSPYDIVAIGDSDDLATAFAQSTVASRYQTLRGADHVGFSFTEKSRVQLAANTGETLRYAMPLVTPPPTSPPSTPTSTSTPTPTPTSTGKPR